MNRLAKTAWIAGALLAAAGTALYLQRSAIALQLMEREVQRRTADAKPLERLPDGLHVGLCGAGAPLPDPLRGGPCTVVVAGRRMFLVDAGASAARRLTLMQLSLGQLEAAFLTHYHSDHIDGLGEVMLQHWAQGSASAPLPVYGPPGLEAVLDGFQAAYAQDRALRIAHHGPAVLPPAGSGAAARSFTLEGEQARQVLIDEPELQIVAFAVDHAPVRNAVGYRIRYKDRSLVISGDTRRSAAVEREARGVDLLMHEALAPKLIGLFQHHLAQAGRPGPARVMEDVLSYHSSPADAAGIAQRAGARALLLYHIMPMLPPALEERFLDGAGGLYAGPLHIGRDGDWVSMPAGSRDVRFGRRE